MGGSKLYINGTASVVGVCVFFLSGKSSDFISLDGLLQLCYDLSSSLNRLLDVSDDSFWRTGWVYVRVQHQIAFIYDGLSKLILVM